MWYYAGFVDTWRQMHVFWWLVHTALYFSICIEYHRLFGVYLSFFFIKVNVFIILDPDPFISISRQGIANFRWFYIIIDCRHDIYFCHMTVMASRITGQSPVCLTVCSDWHQTKVKGLRYYPFVRGIHWWPVDSPHKGTVTPKIVSLDDVIMTLEAWLCVHAECGWSALFRHPCNVNVNVW